MDWPDDSDEAGYYAFEPERFLIPPMEGFLRRMFGAPWGVILVSAPDFINLPTILEFLANFSLQQVYYSGFSAEAGEFHELKGERRRLRTIQEVLEDAKAALDKRKEQESEEPRFVRYLEAASREPEEEPDETRYAELDDAGLPRRMSRNSDVVFIPELSPGLVQAAVEEAMTGHLVVSGIRADGSFPAMRRFLDLLGTETGYLAAASLMGIIALNTVARICQECIVKVEHELSDEDVLMIGGQTKTLYSFRGMGCESCNGTGYRGRILIHEGFEMSPKMRLGVIRSIPPRQLRIMAKREGMRTLLDAAWTLAEAAETSLDEVVRIAEITDPGDEAPDIRPE